MPEGDSIYKLREKLIPLIRGEKFVEVTTYGFPRPILVGVQVVDIRSDGKHLLIELDNGLTIHIHLGMPGRFRAIPYAESTPKSATLAMRTDKALACFFRTPKVDFVKSAFLHAERGLRNLGPDLLGDPANDATTLDTAMTNARATPHKTIGELLLDQRIAAGIGNVIKNEALFIKRIDPRMPPKLVTDAELRALFVESQRLLRMNLGPWRRTTTADRSKGQTPPMGYGRVYVYGRANRPCMRCFTKIESYALGVDARRTYSCPRCQPARTDALAPLPP